MLLVPINGVKGWNMAHVEWSARIICRQMVRVRVPGMVGGGVRGFGFVVQVAADYKNTYRYLIIKLAQLHN